MRQKIKKISTRPLYGDARADQKHVIFLYGLTDIICVKLLLENKKQPTTKLSNSILHAGNKLK